MKSQRVRQSSAISEGLAPVGTGLIIAGVLSILQLSGAVTITAAVAFASAFLVWRVPRFPVFGDHRAWGAIGWLIG